MIHDSTLNIAILEDSVNEIELLVSQLRNAGVAVHAQKAPTEEAFDKLIKAFSLDLVLCNQRMQNPSVISAIEIIKRSGKDIPVIVLDDNYDQTTAVNVMNFGVRDYVAKGNVDHLALIIKREAADLKIRRKFRVQDKAVREAEKRCHTLLESSRDAIAYVHEGMHIHANPVYLEKFGFHDLDEIAGIPIMDMVAPDDHAKFKEFLKKYSKGEVKAASLEVKGVTPDGGHFNAIMEFSPASIDGEACTQIIIRAQTHDKEIEKKLKHLTSQDVLTGLYNRQYFLEELEQVVTEASAGVQSSALLYIEPDNFKEVKNAVGIAGTDIILSELGALIKKHTLDKAISARLSDHTFTMLVREEDISQIQSQAEKIRDEIEHHICDIDGRSMTVTVSIGISVIGETVSSSQEVISHADVACEIKKAAIKFTCITRSLICKPVRTVINIGRTCYVMP